jgi:hypothetical protein
MNTSPATAVEARGLVLRVEQSPVDVVGPVVVGAHQVADAAAGVVEDPRPAVPADVVEGAHLLVVVPDDDHRRRADLHGDVVTGLGHLRLGGHEQPVLRPDRRHVEVEDLLARVEGRLQAVPGGAAADEGGDVVLDGRPLELDGHGASPRDRAGVVHDHDARYGS